MVSRTDGDPPHLSLLSSLSSVCPSQKTSVCRFKTSSCVPAPRAHVVTHVRVVAVHTGTFWVYTRRFFLRAKPRHTPNHTHNTTQHNTQHTTQHTHHAHTTQHHNTQHHTQTEGHREKQTETERHRERQTETERHRERQTETEREKRRN